MKRCKKESMFLICVLLITSFLLFSCKNPSVIDDTTSGKDPIGDNSTVETEKEWTILIYMCGSDLESRSGECSKNINQIAAAQNNDNVNVVIQTGGAKKWKKDGISPYSTDRYLVENNNITLVERTPKSLNFGSPETLTDFINFGLEKYPAKHTGIILWNHGGGSLKGVCFDENFSYDSLNLNELKTVFTNANLKKKLDFIGFDACLMSNFETAYILSSFADNMIASAEKEPIGGWDYSTFIASVDSSDLYNNILEAYSLKSANKDYYTLTHIDLTKFDAITNAFNSLIAKMQEKDSRYLINAINDATLYGSNASNLYDLGNLFSLYDIDCDMSSVINYVAGSKRATGTGISVYFPFLDSSSLGDYIEINPYKEYSNFLLSYYRSSQDEKVSFLSYAEEIDSKLSFKLTKESLDYVAKIEYFLFQSIDEEDAMTTLGSDNDYIVNDNEIVIDFKGRWVKFADNWLYCTIIDEIDDYTIYQTPIKVNDSETVLYFVYDTIEKNIMILGYIYDENGRLYDLEDGAVISMVNRKMTELGYTDTYTNSFVYDSKTTEITIGNLPDGIYQYTVFVTDVYGKRYTGGTAVVKIQNGNLSIITITSDEVTYPEE